MDLLKSGVPYELAIGPMRPLSAERRLAMFVISGEMRGAKWDWHKMRWDEKKS